MRIAILVVNLFLFAGFFFNSLQNGFNRAALSTWFSLCFGILLAFNARFFWIGLHLNSDSSAASHQKHRYDGPEKRSHFRVAYEPNRRPHIIIHDHIFEVIDISQKGLRFLNHKDAILTGKIEGRIAFPDGDVMEIAGTVEWKKADQTSLRLFNTIPHSFIKKELTQLV